MATENNHTVEIVTVVIALAVIAYLGWQLKKADSEIAADNLTINSLRNQIANAPKASSGGGGSSLLNSAKSAAGTALSSLSFL